FEPFARTSSNVFAPSPSGASLHKRSRDLSVLSVEAGLMMPRGSFRGAAPSVASQPPRAKMKMKNSLSFLLATSASDPAGGNVLTARAAPPESSLKNDRRDVMMGLLPGISRGETRGDERGRSKPLPIPPDLLRTWSVRWLSCDWPRCRDTGRRIVGGAREA